MAAMVASTVAAHPAIIDIDMEIEMTEQPEIVTCKFCGIERHETDVCETPPADVCPLIHVALTIEKPQSIMLVNATLHMANNQPIRYPFLMPGSSMMHGVQQQVEQQQAQKAWEEKVLKSAHLASGGPLKLEEFTNAKLGQPWGDDDFKHLQGEPIPLATKRKVSPHIVQAHAKFREIASLGKTAKRKEWYDFMVSFPLTPGQTRRRKTVMLAKHKKWPLDLPVATLTPQGYLGGRVVKHDREYGDRCLVEFTVMVNMGDANGSRFCHIIPFRNLRNLEKS